VLAIVAVYPRDRRLEAPAAKSWSQLFNAASSIGAHLEEADAAATKRHFIALNRGALREMREARYWLKVIAQGRLEGWQSLGDIPDEASQLVAILMAIVRNASKTPDWRK
jgi:four helix bundle protein